MLSRQLANSRSTAHATRSAASVIRCAMAASAAARSCTSARTPATASRPPGKTVVKAKTRTNRLLIRRRPSGPWLLPMLGTSAYNTKVTSTTGATGRRGDDPLWPQRECEEDVARRNRHVLRAAGHVGDRTADDARRERC